MLADVDGWGPVKPASHIAVIAVSVWLSLFVVKWSFCVWSDADTPEAVIISADLKDNA